MFRSVQPAAAAWPAATATEWPVGVAARKVAGVAIRRRPGEGARRGRAGRAMGAVRPGARESIDAVGSV